MIRKEALNDLDMMLDELVQAELKAEANMEYEVFADKKYHNDWRVEAVDSEGACFVTIFSGPNAESRAHEYATWKAGSGG